MSRSERSHTERSRAERSDRAERTDRTNKPSITDRADVSRTEGTERTDRTDKIDRSTLQGYLSIPRVYWTSIPAGSRIKFVFADRMRAGGFFRGVAIIGGKQSVIVSRRNDTNANLARGTAEMVAIPIDRITELWKRFPAELCIEMQMLFHMVSRK